MCCLKESIASLGPAAAIQSTSESEKERKKKKEWKYLFNYDSLYIIFIYLLNIYSITRLYIKILHVGFNLVRIQEALGKILYKEKTDNVITEIVLNQITEL